MEVLGLDVKREHVCQKHSEGGRNILGGVGTEIARRVERRLAALSRVLYTHFGPSFRVDRPFDVKRDTVDSAFDDCLRRATWACARAPWVRFRSSTNIPVPCRASAWS